MAQEPLDFLNPFDDLNLDATEGFILSADGVRPSLGSWVLHSKTAREAILQFALERRDRNLSSHRQLIEKFDERLRGRQMVESKFENVLLDLVMKAVVENDAHALVSLVEPNGRVRPIRSDSADRLLVTELEDGLVKIFMSTLFQKFSDQLQIMRDDPEGQIVMRDPLFLLSTMADVVKQDTIIDQGLNPLILRNFVKVALGKRVSVGGEARRRTRLAAGQFIDLISK